jgi:hypothetical protein
LAWSVLAAVWAAPIDGILLAAERRRAPARDWLSAATHRWFALAVACFWGAA